METIFLETSILIHRLLYESWRQEQIEANLDRKKVITSEYVLMEFRRNTLQAINYLCSRLRFLQQEGISEVRLGEFLVTLSQAFAIFHSTRALQSVILALSLVAEGFESHPYPIVKLIGELEWHRASLWANARRLASEIINKTYCDLVKEEVEIGDFIHSRLSCNANFLVKKFDQKKHAKTAKCQLVQFLSAHQEQLTTIQQAMETAPLEKVDRRTLSALRRVNADVTKALGERTCWALGDVIIALEMPQDALFYTVDGHFEVICRAIGKRVFVEKQHRCEESESKGGQCPPYKSQ